MSYVERIDALVLGIAGNSPGYLAQTGEIKAFTEQQQIVQQAPKALFPIFVQGDSSFLNQMPFSDNELMLPTDLDALVQMEPELAVKFKVIYQTNGDLSQLIPKSLTLINDATHRNKIVTKLAQKKNWGNCSKGMASTDMHIKSLQPNTEIEQLRLCGFHARNEQWQLCSYDISISQYILFYQELTDWIVEQIQNQKDENTLHNISELIQLTNQPESITVAIGAPSYTKYGKNHNLQSGDQMLVCLYDQRIYQINDIQDLLFRNKLLEIVDPRIIWLHQKVCNRINKMQLQINETQLCVEK